MKFHELRSGDMFKSNATGMLFIKAKEGSDIFLNLRYYKAMDERINAFCLDKRLPLRPAIFRNDEEIEKIDFDVVI